MAKRRASSNQRQSNDTPSNSSPNSASTFGDGAAYFGLDSDIGFMEESSSVTTGRKIVTILSDEPSDKKKVMAYFSARDIKDMMQAGDYEESAYNSDDASKCEAVVFDHLPIIVLNDSPIVQSALTAPALSQNDDEIRRLFVVEDEVRHFASCLEPDSENDRMLPDAMAAHVRSPSGKLALSAYHEGYLRGVQSLATQLLREDSNAERTSNTIDTPFSDSDAAGCLNDTQALTWGLQATGVSNSSLSGNGIRIAILDTGFEFGHPDVSFASRVIGSTSTVGGTAQDNHGHGTHVAGTACGPRIPGIGSRRYGIAYESEILIAKVLGPSGGNDSTILAGINWAIGRGCHLINMSLGPRVCRLSRPYATSHERAARVAMDRGVLMIAAAGNNSRRPGLKCPVVGPAAAPSIVAVSAIDRCGQIAVFSNQGQDNDGGEINFAAPGVGVYSSWINPRRHNTIDGTSMAAPHVAGIAALVAQETGLRGLALYRELRSRAKNIGHTRPDVGNGLATV